MTFPFPYHAPREHKLINIIHSLGLTSGLKLVLDSTDAQSYTSGQKWLDRSGNGYDFFLGTDGTVTTDDPTFNGTAGTPQAYWSFDGGDTFNYATTPEAWMETIHKDGAIFTFIVWARLASTASQGFVGNGVSGGGLRGFYLSSSSGGLISFVVGTGTAAALNQTGGAVSTGVWQMYSVSINENGGAGAGLLGVNDSFTTFNPAYTSPSSSNANNRIRIAARGPSEGVMSNGGRMTMLGAWQGTSLTQAQITNVFSKTRRLFGV